MPGGPYHNPFPRAPILPPPQPLLQADRPCRGVVILLAVLFIAVPGLVALGILGVLAWLVWAAW